MSADGPSTLFDASFVDTSVETAWQRLEVQIEFARAFWLGFVFSTAPREIDKLREFAATLLFDRNKTMCHRKLEDPESFGDLLPWLLHARETEMADCVWIESIISDSPGASETPFKNAWEKFFLLANQKRDALRKTLRGGLVFAAPPAIKPRIRDDAPDLWSVRALVMDVESRLSAPLEHTGIIRIPVATPLPSTNEFTESIYIPSNANPVLLNQPFELREPVSPVASQSRKYFDARREIRRSKETSALPSVLPLAVRPLRPASDRFEPVDSRVRVHGSSSGKKGAFSFTWAEYEIVESFIAAGRLNEAEEHAQLVLASVDTDKVLDSAYAHHLLSKVHEMRDNNVEALRDMERALQAYQLAAPKYVPIDWYLRTGQLAATLDNPSALNYLSNAVSECRKRVRESETIESLRNLVSSLQALGDWNMGHEQRDAAGMLFYDAVSVSRRLLDLCGDKDLESCFSLLTSLVRYGDFCRRDNDFSNASAAIEESVHLGEKLCQMDPDSRWSLSQYAITLNRLAGLKQSIDDWEGARLVYRQSLDIRRQVVAMRGDRESLQRLISVLNKLASVEAFLGNDDTAAKLTHESYALDQQLRQ